jgi:SAM-dependent methyltransferase
MWIDVSDLHAFYGDLLGQMTQRLLRQRLRALWPSVRGETVLGLGYATPFLLPFREEAARTLAFDPAGQGVVRWPREGRNLAALVDENDLPLADRSIDRAILVHALECAEHVRPMLREVWRVMADGGKLIVIVPNRTGLWAQFESSPFSHGQPYSTGQLGRLLRANMFTPLAEARALYVPPVRSRMLLRMAPTLERFGDRWIGRFAGVSIVECSKQLYAMTGLVEAQPAIRMARPRLRIAAAREDNLPPPSAARSDGAGTPPAEA